MNVKNFLRVFILSIVAAAIVFILALPWRSMDEGRYTIFTPYEYPVAAGTPEWLELGTHFDMINVCRVPEPLVEQMSTEALLKTYLNHPLAQDVFAYDSHDSGFQVLKDYYSMGLDELLKREDLSEAVREEYNGIDICTDIICLDEMDAEEYLETYEEEIEDKYRMLLLEVVAAEMDERQRSIELVNTLLDKDREKKGNPSFYGSQARGIFARVLGERYQAEAMGGK